MALNWTHDEVASHLKKWYSVADACIPSNSVKFFASDALVQFNNMEPAIGPAAIEAFFYSVANLLTRQSRQSMRFDVIGHRIYDETLHTLVAKADPEQKEVVIHQMNVYDVVPDGEPEAGKFRRWMAFTERTELFERISMGEVVK